MSITVIRTLTRPTTDVKFITDTNLPEIAKFLNRISEFEANGSITNETTLSNQDLTMTWSTTYKDIDTLNAVGVAGVASVREFQQSGQIVDSVILYGIDKPFSVTTTYELPDGTDATEVVSKLTESLSESLMITQLPDIVASGNTVSVVETFLQVPESQNGLWDDSEIITDLFGAGIERKKTWTLL